MLHYNGIDVSEGIDINKTSALKECDICQNMYLSVEGFNFQPDVFNGSHDVFMISIKLSDFADLNIYVEAKLLHYHKVTTKILFKRIKRNIIKHKNLLSHIFGDIEILKHKFHLY